ncbi:antibiotic biosynthesis monooxygenase family protein [Roseomonas gilardii]|uniref:antibiotic biosynthesis monooxygenase family protein n=1 Tax=Roseomonas gilardii TaxID=257708 RepID=UPI00047FC2B2|nr:antibiotic biosynthesis monooxygenase family protein [Roseomonas gilardii]
MANFVEMDPAVPLASQLQDEGGPVILINTFTVAPEDADKLLAAWADDAALMKRQPGFISTQLHRGIAGSGVFLNYAVWQSTAHFRAAFENPEFRAKLGAYPASSKASPHLFRKVEVPGICVA